MLYQLIYSALIFQVTIYYSKLEALVPLINKKSCRIIDSFPHTQFNILLINADKYFTGNKVLQNV